MNSRNRRRGYARRETRARGQSRERHIFGTVKVGEKGQIVIPKEARTVFGIQPGDTLLVLGDETRGIVVTRPEVMRDVAARIFDESDES